MFRVVKIIIVACVCLMNLSGFGQNGEITTSSQYPRLLQAEVPFYPPVAATGRFGGTIEIDVVVEDGIIKETKIRRETIEIPSGEEGWKSNVKGEPTGLIRYLTVPSLENLKTWRFDRREKGRFTVTFIYKMEGEETPLPENHKIELDLPLTVKITAKPFKPTQT